MRARALQQAPLPLRYFQEMAQTLLERLCSGMESLEKFPEMMHWIKLILFGSQLISI